MLRRDRVGSVVGLVRRIAGGFVIAALALPAMAHAAFPGTNGKIVYEGPGLSGLSNTTLFSMNPDGSGKTNLTPNPVSAPARRGGGIGSFHPAYSADGRKIV